MPPENVTVRTATIEDLDNVGQDYYLSRSVLERKIEAGEVFLVYLGEMPCGYIRLEYLWSLIPYIALIRVREDQRGKGLSRALLKFVEERLRNQGYDFLYSSSQVNEPAPQAWHRHMGFEECGLINGINEGGIGEVFFRKQLKVPDHA
jgi:GNAT superfamily N-acetyltransferase